MRLMCGECGGDVFHIEVLVDDISRTGIMTADINHPSRMVAFCLKPACEGAIFFQVPAPRMHADWIAKEDVDSAVRYFGTCPVCTFTTEASDKFIGFPCRHVRSDNSPCPGRVDTIYERTVYFMKGAMP